MKNKRPPLAAICLRCFNEQSDNGKHATEEFYCEHNEVWAVQRADGGWVLSTGVSADYHKAMLSDAREANPGEERRAQPTDRLH